MAILDCLATRHCHSKGVLAGVRIRTVLLLLMECPQLDRQNPGVNRWRRAPARGCCARRAFLAARERTVMLFFRPWGAVVSLSFRLDHKIFSALSRLVLILHVRGRSRSSEGLV